MPAARRSLSFDPIAAVAFGTAVRALRVAKEVAQDEFAIMANIDRSYYGKLERGERQPSLGIILRIATALGVSAAELVAATERALPKRRARRSE